MLRFLHAADIHLDSAPQDLERYEGAPVELCGQPTRRALENLVELAIARQVQFVLIAGDLYDSDWDDYNTGLFFIKQMGRLREAGIRVFMIRGNHDAASRITRWLRLPDNVHMLSHEQAETVVLDDCGVAVHGRGFAQAAELENLVLQYPMALRGLFNIGLLHTSLEGVIGHEPYAPCVVDDLRVKHYDYWALGHVHTRNQAICDQPAIVFPGNLQGRHVRECGPKGCVLVTVDKDELPVLEFCPLDVVRWEIAQVDVSAADQPDDVLQLVAEQLDRVVRRTDERPAAVRVVLRGNTELHRQLLADADRWEGEVRAIALARNADRLWVERVRIETRPRREAGRGASAGGPLGHLMEYLTQLRSDPEALDRLASQFEDVQRKLLTSVHDHPEWRELSRPEYVQRMLDQVEAQLVSRLSSQEECA